MSLRDINTRNASSPTSDQAVFRMKFREWRVQTAISLLTWTALLWRSMWTTALCTCSLQEDTTTDGKIVVMMPQRASETQKCPLCMSIASLNPHPEVSPRRDARAPMEEETQNLQQMMRVMLTLCEIGLCVPMKATSQNKEIAFYYAGSTRSQTDLLIDITCKMDGCYRTVIEELLWIVDDKRRQIAPFDRVCEALEQARHDLQVCYDCHIKGSRRSRQMERQWWKDM